MLSNLARLGSLALALALVGCAADAADEGTGSQASDETSLSRTHGNPNPNPTATTPGAQLSVHTTLGIPEAASVNDPVHALLVHSQWVASFDSTKKNPRWTSWELTTAWMGSASRSNNFIEDTLLPSNIAQPINSDFTNSGYERGHICPSADRTDNATDNQGTFLFTNVVPQTAQSNTGTWETLETYERTLARSNTVFIIAGSIYEGTTKTVGGGVHVPSSMFKVVVVMSGSHPGPGDVTKSTRVITVDIPNTTSVSGSYANYRTSFGDIEQKTGFRFLSDVPSDIHDALASEVDSQ